MDAKPEFTPTIQAIILPTEMEETWVNYALKSENIARLYTQYLNKFTNNEYLQSLKKIWGRRNLLPKSLRKKFFLEINTTYGGLIRYY